MNERSDIHIDCTWQEYRELVENHELETDKIYFIIDVNDSDQLIYSLLEEVRNLRNQLNELKEREG